MNPPEELDAIDELFGRQEKYVEDHGFTGRVVRGLPRRRRRGWVNSALLLFATGVGSVLAVFWVPWGNLPAVRTADLLSPGGAILLPWTLAVGVIGSLVWAVMAVVQGLD